MKDKLSGEDEQAKRASKDTIVWYRNGKETKV
jgi:hypothetical protein